MAPVSQKELAMLEKAAAEYALKVLAPEREENDNYPFGPFFEPALEKAGELGFLQIMLPESMEGFDGAVAPLGAVLKALGREDASLGAILLVNAFAQALCLAGDGEGELEKIQSSARTARDRLLACPVMENPGEIAPRVRAGKKGRGITLEGECGYVVLGNLAKKALIPALDSTEEGYSWYLADLDQEGVTLGEPVFSLGLHSCPAVDVTFAGVKAKLVGGEGKGNTLFDKASGPLHAALSALVAGIMEGSYSEALAYAKKRTQGGREIVQWSEIQRILGDMAVKTKAASVLANAACQSVDQREKGASLDAVASFIHVAGLAAEATTDGIQALGGVGYMKDFGQEKRFRDAKHLQAFFGIYPMKKIRYFKDLARINN